MNNSWSTMRGYVAVGIAALAGMGAAAASAATDEAPAAGSAGKEAAIGAPAPAWEALTGVDDQQHSLDELADAKAVAVVFTCNHCPVAQAYEDRLVEFTNDYQQQGVEVVAINVNNLEADKLPAMKQRAEEQAFNFAYLYDPSQAIGRAYGATVTPHAFLLDGDRRLVYRGAIDDNMIADQVTTQYLREATDAVLAGDEPSEAESKAFGCAIQYE